MEVSQKHFKEITLMDSKIFYVPTYQRSYSWDPDLWGMIYKDAIKVFESVMELPKSKIIEPNAVTKSSHFSGTMVLHKSDNNDYAGAFQIIDGQQRFTTMMLMLVALREVAKNLSTHELFGDGAAKVLSTQDSIGNAVTSALMDYQWSEEHDDEIFLPRLKLAHYDKVQFDNLVICSLNTESVIDHAIENSKKEEILPTSRGRGVSSTNSPHTKVTQAIQYFYSKFNKFFKNINHSDYSEESLKLAVPAFAATLLYGFRFVVILTDDTGEDVNDIFESLNARAKPLESFDLLKNLILMKYSRSLHDPSLGLPNDEQFYENYFREFENENSILSKDDKSAKDTEENEHEYILDNSHVPFWLTDKAIQSDRSSSTTINNRTVFLNYWLDANYIRGGKKNSNSSVGLEEQNTEHRYRNVDAIYRAYKSYILELEKYGRFKYSEDICDFGENLKNAAGFYREINEYLNDNSPSDFTAEEFSDNFPVLSKLSKNMDDDGDKNVQVLLEFVKRVIIGFELRALWKQVLWMYKVHKKLSSESFGTLINILDSWAVRRFLPSTYTVNNLNTATVSILESLIRFEDEWSGKGKPELIILRKVGGKNGDKDSPGSYLEFPKNELIRASVSTNKCIVSPTNLQKVKHILVELENQARKANNLMNNSNMPYIDANEVSAVFAVKASKINSSLKEPKDTIAEDKVKAFGTLGNIVLVSGSDTSKKWSKSPKANGVESPALNDEKRYELRKFLINKEWTECSDNATNIDSTFEIIHSRGNRLINELVSRWVEYT